MIAVTEGFRATQDRIQVVQGMLAHARRTRTPESFQAQSKGWLREWERLEADLHAYLSTSSDAPREMAGRS